MAPKGYFRQRSKIVFSLEEKTAMSSEWSDRSKAYFHCSVQIIKTICLRRNEVWIQCLVLEKVDK